MMSQTLEMLLAIDPEKIASRPTKRVYMPRLSELAGADVYFTIQALTVDEAKDIRRKATKTIFRNHQREEFYDEEEAAIWVVLTGVIDPNLRDERLMKKFSVPTPVELVPKLLLSGEIAGLSQEIMKLSGFNATGTLEGEELKN